MTVYCGRYNCVFEAEDEVPKMCDDCTHSFLGHNCKDVITAGLKPKWVQLEFNFNGGSK